MGTNTIRKIHKKTSQNIAIYTKKRTIKKKDAAAD
jgi:hypothetical protein